MKERRKISFCTVCMNRLHHLRLTLPQNMLHNQDYPDCEFILLDYNSGDDLEAWVLENMSSYIASGKLIYYKTTEPLYFHMSHSKNMAAKLGTGDIVCNVDADNYTGQGFASYINDVFSNGENLLLAAEQSANEMLIWDVFGRICVRKDDFVQIGGYDENMLHYGFEDSDFVNRLRMNGLQRKGIPGEFLTAITHPDKDRFAQDWLFTSLSNILLHYISPASSEVLLLLNDGTYKRGTIIDNTTGHAHDYQQSLYPTHNYEFSLLKNEWETGEWTNTGDVIQLFSNRANTSLQYNEQQNIYLETPANAMFYPLASEQLKHEMIFFYSQITNRIKMEGNMSQRKIKANEGKFGGGTVYKNFNYELPITL